MKGALFFAILALALFLGGQMFAPTPVQGYAYIFAGFGDDLAVHLKDGSLALTLKGVRTINYAAGALAILALVNLLLADWKSKPDSKLEFKEAR